MEPEDNHAAEELFEDAHTDDIDGFTDEQCEQFWDPDPLLAEEEKRLAEEVDAEEVAESALVKSEVAKEPLIMDGGRFQDLQDLLLRAVQMSEFHKDNISKVMDVRLAEQALALVAAMQDHVSLNQELVLGSVASVSTAVDRSKKRHADSTDPAVPASQPSSVPQVTATMVQLPNIVGELRPHQLFGVTWLGALYENDVNGILADDMGMGKTVQTIGYISHLISKGVSGPFLVIGPLSTLMNWFIEFQTFSPGTDVLLYHGTKGQRIALQKSVLKCSADGTIEKKNIPIIITSYEVVIADSGFFAKLDLALTVVDEGHRLKNSNCKLIRKLKTIPTKKKLLLTGTPLQNSLSELWSLLNFLMPEIFNSIINFEAWFKFDFSPTLDKTAQGLEASEQRVLAVSTLHKILTPFMLRRIKADTVTDLPGKQEIVLWAPMSITQAAIALSLKNGTFLDNKLAELKSEEGGPPIQGMAQLRNMLMQSRKNCNHPDLINSAFHYDLDFPLPEKILEESGKMTLLALLVNELHKRKHKILIFSQMTKMLDLIHAYFKQRGFAVCRIDGSIHWKGRQQAMLDFKTKPENWVFLLSTRAGGLGINLTSADSVIIYDSDWNPTSDMQAMDRCYRINQKKPVLVFRLATANSVDSHILKRAASKKALERLVVKKGAFVAKENSSTDSCMSAAEIQDILSSSVLRDDNPASVQVSRATLKKLLNRKHLELGQDPTVPYPLVGTGYEVITC